MSKAQKIAFIGLGVMGGPMAGHLARAGYSVVGYNRTQARAEMWRDTYGTEELDVAIATSPAQAVEGCTAVFACLGNDQDVESVMLEDGRVFQAMQDGAVFVDHTTISPAMARYLANSREVYGRVHCLDAPVSGGQAGAENGSLSVMCGGSTLALAHAREFIECYASRIVHVGSDGAGQAAKAVNQVCIAGVLAGLSEAIRLAQALELNTDKVLEAIRGGAAQSWQMENRWQTMVKDEFDFGFAVDWMRKDLAIALEEGAKHEMDLPVTELVDQFYADVQAAGRGRSDTSALITRLPKSKA
ncbi:MAG: NAD(P)-dependent oxidoreductase [Pseudomonadota bacterium]